MRFYERAGAMPFNAGQRGDGESGMAKLSAEVGCRIEVENSPTLESIAHNEGDGRRDSMDFPSSAKRDNGGVSKIKAPENLGSWISRYLAQP